MSAQSDQTCKTDHTCKTIIVIGAGLVGLATAHALADEGHSVTVIDREGPAAGASRGNAGWLAHTDIEPLASPKMLRQVPRFLLDPLGPLAIRREYILKIMPWLTRLLLASRPSQIEASMEAIASLQALAMPAWDKLSDQLKLGALIHRRGGLYVFDDAAAFARAKPHFAFQKSLGIAVDLIESYELRQMEPALALSIIGGAFFPDAAHVSDPRLMTEALFDTALARGITFKKAIVTRVESQPRPIVHFADQTSLAPDALVIAAGAWSKPLAGMLGDKIPLDTERGYNVSFPGLAGLIKRPVSFQGHGFVATPLATGLRLGGAVELGGLELPPNHERTRAIHTKARRYLRDVPDIETGTMWMGFRPSLPDSLPVIGHAKTSRSVVYAFGHGHLGLTQSAATGSLVADLLAGRTPAIDLTPFSPQRF